MSFPCKVISCCFRLSCFREGRGELLPEINRRVRSPRLDPRQIEIGMKVENPPKNQIRFGKSVRVAEGAQADIFRRPGPESPDFEKRFTKRRRILLLGERNGAV